MQKTEDREVVHLYIGYIVLVAFMRRSAHRAAFNSFIYKEVLDQLTSVYGGHTVRVVSILLQ